MSPGLKVPEIMTYRFEISMYDCRIEIMEIADTQYYCSPLPTRG